MNPFISRHAQKIAGVLHCWDRVIISGTIPEIGYRDAMTSFPRSRNILLFNYAEWTKPLAERIRQKEGLSYGVNSSLSANVIDRNGSWSVRAIAAPQNIAKVEAAFLDEIGKALRDGFTAPEVAAAKSGLLQQRLQGRAQDGSLAGRWSSYLFYGKTFADSQAFEDKIAALKPEEVVAAMRRHIDPARMTIIKAGDFAKVAKSAGEKRRSPTEVR